MKNVIANGWYWLGGVAVASSGILLARVIGPHSDQGLRLPLTIAGQLLALGGLLVICVGVSRRVHRTSNSP